MSEFTKEEITYRCEINEIDMAFLPVIRRLLLLHDKKLILSVLQDWVVRMQK